MVRLPGALILAIFPRRLLQRFIDELTLGDSPLDLGELVGRLNRDNRQALASEWELVVLHALSRSGRIHHEVDLGGSSRVDVLYEGRGAFHLGFAADITCSSDYNSDKDNPVDRVFEFVGQKSRKLGLGGGFDITIPGEKDGPYGNAKMRLALRPHNQIDAVLRVSVEPWLRSLAVLRPERDSLEVREDGVRLSVHYDSRSSFLSGGYPSYAAAYSRTRNPVYNALRAKADQLRRSGFDGPVGIFLCDRDCSLLHSTSTGADAFSLRDVFREFLRQNKSVSFIVAFAVRDEGRWPHGIVPKLEITVVHNPWSRYPVDDDELRSALKPVEALPQPEQTPGNALAWMVRHPRQGRRWSTLTQSGGSSVSKIAISSRRFLELLAGQWTGEDFQKEYGMGDRPGRQLQPFAAALASGRLIRQIQISRMPDKDDDVIEIEFGEPDPAVSRFVVRKET